MQTNYLTQQQDVPNFERLFPLYEFHHNELNGEQEAQPDRQYETLRNIVDYSVIEERAWRLIASHARPEKRLAFNEAEDNARTALFEALTKSGHLSRIELEGDPNVVHAQIVERLLNGYDPELPEAELRRRFAELCEELVDHEVFQKVAAGELPMHTRTYVASDFAVSLGEYANKFGYRSENKKGMLREKSLVKKNGAFVKVIEQISRSNSDPDETIAAFGEMGINVPRKYGSDIDLLGVHVTRVVDEASEGLVGLMRRLDRFKGSDIMYGEAKTAETVSYEDVARISREREQRMELFVKRLAKTERDLDQLEQTGQITYQEWMCRYRQEVLECVRQICIINPDYTEGVLGGGAVKEAYLKAHDQFMSGDISGAADTIGTVASQENSIVICGGDTANNHQTNGPNSNSIAKQKREQSQAKEQWDWKKGLCRVELCAFRNKKTDVGPCDVCMTCQAYFDDDKDPTTEYRKHQLEVARAAILDATWNDQHSQQGLKNNSIHQQYGEFSEVKTIYTIGGAKEIIVDRRTGYELAA